MKPNQQGIEALTLRRATVADTDKVRYRVYSTPKDFIAVIAESALMAVKVSGISKPHKIVRDLPTEGISIEAKKMAAIDPNMMRVSMPTASPAMPKERLVTELSNEPPPPKSSFFKPMTIGDLQHKGVSRARILPPAMVNQIIEEHARAAMPPMPEAEPVTAPSMPEPAASEDEAIFAAPPAPPMPPEEKLLQMAKDLPMPAAPVESSSGNEPVLSPEEVDKLLNG